MSSSTLNVRILRSLRCEYRFADNTESTKGAPAITRWSWRGLQFPRIRGEVSCIFWTKWTVGVYGAWHVYIKNYRAYTQRRRIITNVLTRQSNLTGQLRLLEMLLKTIPCICFAKALVCIIIQGIVRTIELPERPPSFRVRGKSVFWL